MISEDFNTQLDVGIRSEKLLQTVAEHALQICNEDQDLGWDRAWTFESTLGHRTRLDFIIADNS